MITEIILGGIISISTEGSKTILVTGGSGVIGKIICKKLLLSGYIVENWDLNTKKHKNFYVNNYKIVRLDFNNKNLLQKKLLNIKKKQNKYFAVIFAHGIHEIGDLWNYKQSTIDKFMQVNFQANALIISHLSKQIESRIINLSSISTLIPIPYSGIYSASKAALNSWLTSVNFELNLIGVKTSNLIVGNINTGFNEKGRRLSLFRKNTISNEYIISLSNRINSRLGIDPEVIANKILKILESRHPKNTYLYGKNVKLFNLIEKFLGSNFAIILAHKYITRKQ